MKKFLLSLLFSLGVIASSFAEEKLVAEMPAVNSTNWPSSNGYSTSITSKNGDWTATNFNNNNLGWAFFRCGSKNAASVATIAKLSPIPESVTTVIFTVADKAGSVNSVKVYVADNSSFTNADVYDFAVLTYATEADYSLTITAPKANSYYKLVIDNPKGSNGSFSVRALKFYAEDGGPAKTPVTLSWSKETETINLGDEFVAPTLSVEPAEAAASVTYEAEGLLSIENGKIVLGEGVGTGSVTASINSDDYYGQSATYTVTVIDPNAIEDKLVVTNFVSTQGSYSVYNYASPVSGIRYSARVIYNGGNFQTNGAFIYIINDTEVPNANPNNLVIDKISLKFTSGTSNNRSITVKFAAEAGENYTAYADESKTFTKTAEVTEFSYAPNGDYKAFAMTSSSAVYVEYVTITYRKSDAPIKQPHGLAFAESAMDVEVDYMGAGVTLSNPNGLDVVYSSSNTTVADVDPTDGSLLAYAPGTTTITAKTEGNDEFNGGSVSYTLTVVAKPYANLFDVVKNAKDKDKIVAVGDFEVIYHNGSNTILTDGVSNILIYDNKVTAEAGTKISKIEATVNEYYSLFQLANATLTEGGEGATIEARELTTFEGVNYDDQLFDQVVVKGAAISGVSGKQGTLNLGSESIAMWNNFNIDGYANTAAGETVTVTGFVWRNNSTLQINPISIVKEESGKVDAKLTWSVEEYTVVEYTEVSEGLPVLTNPLGIEVVYESSDEEVVMYEDGLLMSFAPGTAVITATPADTEKYYGSASFTVTVTAKPHLGAILVNGQEVKDDQTIDVVLNSEITFSAENAEMIEYKIEGNEGTVAGEIVEDSSCKFTAPAALGEYMVTLSATGCGEGAEVVFMLNVTEKPAITEETLNFLENSYGMKTGSQNADNTELTGTVFTYTVNSRTGHYSDGLRMYKPNGGVDATIKATAPMGYVVAEIEPRTATDLAVTAAGFATSYGHGAGVVTFTGSTTYKLPKLYVKVEKVDAPDAESYSPDHSSFVASPNADGSITIEITHADKHAAIYYKHTAADQPAQARRRVASHEGYEVANATVVDEKSVHSFTVPSAGNVEYYAYHTATDTKGDVKTITVDANGGVTSITELTVDLLDAAAPAYDLQGRRVAAPTRGLYIQNGRKLFLR